MRVDYTYDPDSDRLSRLFVDKIGQLALLDLRYSYDLAGNVTQIDDGARVKRIVDDGTTETAIATIYVAGMEIRLVDDVEEQRTVYYAMGGAFRIIGGDDEGLYFRHGDHLGSTSVLSDEGGLKVAPAGSEVVYAPFGEIREGDLSDLTDFGFTGQQLDRSTGGLMYYGARYYLPELRRFISADTTVPGAGNPQAFNRYAYALNNPVKYIDPTGHTVDCAPWDDDCDEDKKKENQPEPPKPQVDEEAKEVKEGPGDSETVGEDELNITSVHFDGQAELNQDKQGSIGVLASLAPANTEGDPPLEEDAPPIAPKRDAPWLELCIHLGLWVVLGRTRNHGTTSASTM